MKDHNKIIFPRLDIIAYKEAPRDWGKLTSDLKEQLKKVPEGTILLQTTKIDKKHGCTRVFGTMAVEHHNKITAIPFLCGGLKKGAVPGMIYGSGNFDPESNSIGPISKITHISHDHNGPKDWACEVAVLKQNFKGRDGIWFHAMAYMDGVSEGCIAYPRKHQAAAEKLLRQSVGMDVIMLPSTKAGGLRYVDHHKHPDERLAKAKESADKLVSNKHNNQEVHPLHLIQPHKEKSRRK